MSSCLDHCLGDLAHAIQYVAFVGDQSLKSPDRNAHVGGRNASLFNDRCEPREGLTWTLRSPANFKSRISDLLGILVILTPPFLICTLSDQSLIVSAPDQAHTRLVQEYFGNTIAMHEAIDDIQSEVASSSQLSRGDSKNAPS
jgi:hypothetical protein